MKILYESDCGGSVKADYTSTPQEETENLEASKTLADLGKNVILLGTSKITGVRSADAFFDNEFWEIKTNYKPTVSAIDNALRSCNGQSKNCVLNIKSEISEEILWKGVKGRLHRTEIEKIMIIRNGSVRIFFRPEILK